MIWTMGEMIVEIMRDKVDSPLDKAGVFLGPYPSGAPAIFIDTAARLGHKSGIISGVGCDDFGKNLLDRLNSDGVDTSLVLRDPTCSTGCAFVMYYSNGDRKFIFHIGNTPAAKAKAPDTVPKADFFHVMGCSLMSDDTFGAEIVKTAEKFRKAGAKISFDPNIRPELMGGADTPKRILEMTSVFLPGVAELKMMAGCDTVEASVAKCFENPVLEIIALKRGSKGCTVYTRDASVDFGIYPVTPVDATGAGDSFDAAFICGLADGKPMMDCIRQATSAASLNTAAFGPMEGKISPESVAELICAHPEIG